MIHDACQRGDHAMGYYCSWNGNVDRSYEKLLIMHDLVHNHVIMNAIVTTSSLSYLTMATTGVRVMAAEAPTFLPFFYPALAAVAQRQPAIFEKIVNSALATVSHATVTQDGYGSCQYHCN